MSANPANLFLPQGLIVKVGHSPSKKVGFTCFNGRPLKMMKNTFYFILEAFPFSRYLNFCPDIFGHVGKQLDRKPKVNIKIYFFQNHNILRWEG